MVISSFRISNRTNLKRIYIIKNLYSLRMDREVENSAVLRPPHFGLGATTDHFLNYTAVGGYRPTLVARSTKCGALSSALKINPSSYIFGKAKYLSNYP